MLISRDRIRHAQGQLWIAEDDLLDFGCKPAVGTVITVEESLQDFELAGRVAAIRAGLRVDSLVWWLLPINNDDIYEGGE